MGKPQVLINNWYVFGKQLRGEVADHPRFDAGTPVVTSMIVDMPAHPKSGDTVETMNTIYKLGTPPQRVKVEDE